MIHESVTFVGLRYGLWFWWQDCTAVIQVLPIDLFPTTILRYYVTPSLIGQAHTQNDPCAFHDHGWFTAMVPFCIIAWSLGYMPQLSKHGSWWWPGPWFNIKMSSYQYRKSHCGDKTVVRSSYLHNGISYLAPGHRQLPCCPILVNIKLVIVMDTIFNHRSWILFLFWWILVLSVPMIYCKKKFEQHCCTTDFRE